MLENKFQALLVKDLEEMFPGCFVLHTDNGDIQGFPDLTILYRKNWATLECKKSLNEPYQPNQQYYIKVLDDMSFSSMICPENKEAVLHELQLAFRPRGSACLSLT